ncbi:MAG: hypothetical protein KDA84_08135, partial [Planctomycetaceae bacterium]|nr:hypothetical protein [Planctomycetaceae bacterium]
LSTLGPWYYRFPQFRRWLEQEEDNTDELLKELTPWWRELTQDLDDVWIRAIRVYRGFTRQHAPPWPKGIGDDLEARKPLYAAFRKAFAEGQASFWTILSGVRDPQTGKPLLDLAQVFHNETDNIDELCVLVHALGSCIELHIEELMETPLVETEPSRNLNTAWDRFREAKHHLAYATPTTDHQLQFKREHDRPLCFHPKSRQQRFLREMCLLRILWDLSTRQRGRRFVRMMRDGDRRNNARATKSSGQVFTPDLITDLTQLTDFLTDVQTTN